MKKWILPVSVLLVLLVGGLGVYLLVPTKSEYCWLVFGPEAKLRVLVRLQENHLQGQRFYFDRGSNDEVIVSTRTGKSGRRYSVIDDPDNQTTYTITGMARLDDSRPSYLCVDVHIQGSVEYDQYCGVELTSSPDNAKEAHFHGPLTVDLTPKAPWAFRRGDEPTRLRVNIGTINAEKGCWVVVRTLRSKDQPDFPTGVYPVADVEFPAKGNGPPIKRRYPLDEPC